MILLALISFISTLCNSQVAFYQLQNCSFVKTYGRRTFVLIKCIARVVFFNRLFMIQCSISNLFIRNNSVNHIMILIFNTSKGCYNNHLLIKILKITSNSLLLALAWIRKIHRILIFFFLYASYSTKYVHLFCYKNYLHTFTLCSLQIL